MMSNGVGSNVIIKGLSVNDVDLFILGTYAQSLQTHFLTSQKMIDEHKSAWGSQTGSNKLFTPQDACMLIASRKKKSSSRLKAF